MSDPIIVALIGLSGTVLGVLVPPLISFLREMPRQGKDGLHTLTKGEWKGYLKDVYRTDGIRRPEKEPLKITMEKPFFSSFMRGELFLRRYDGTTVDVILERGVLRHRCVMFHYRNRDNEVRQMGTITFFLSELGDQITGFHTGWSPFDKCYVVGTMMATKGASIASIAQAMDAVVQALPQVEGALDKPGTPCSTV